MVSSEPHAKCPFTESNKRYCASKQKTAFIQSISAEKDLYACGIMVEAAQILFGKKWISSNAVENQNEEKIEKARKSAIKFLSMS